MFRYATFILLLLGLFLTTTPTMAAEPTMAPPAVAVTLESFEAVADANGVKVVWSTITEVNTIGFRVYRGTSRDGTLVRLTGLIPTQAPNGGGARYEFIDFSAQADNTYYYYLDAVGSDNQAVRYGPAIIDLTPTAVTVADFNASSQAAPLGWIGAMAAGVVIAGGLILWRRRA